MFQIWKHRSILFFSPGKYVFHVSNCCKNGLKSLQRCVDEVIYIFFNGGILTHPRHTQQFEPSSRDQRRRDFRCILMYNKYMQLRLS